MSADSYPIPPDRWYLPLVDHFLRIAASGWVPAGWFEKNLPAIEQRHANNGELNIEIVSHCWNYAHFLIYQLSSLVKFPPTAGTVTMTVYYCEEDQKTSALLAYFSTLEIPRVRWNWQALPRQALFRRAIGRNHAALNSQADWVWFTDCDLMFREGCLDGLIAQLQGRSDALIYPKFERCTSLLSNEDPMLSIDFKQLSVTDVDTTQFEEFKRTRATGPLQITHGDVARACGYCAALSYYQRPSATWCKAREDRAFRWLLRTQGTPLAIPGVYRIRHVFKGRYTGSSLNTGLRSYLRRLSSWWQHKRNKRQN
ncbi:MAG TPA: glycosyltransferase family 2 protein [Marinagarivorans sp.]